ncbi:hypothetical protein [Burkholderia territorii]|uniref:Uncharacterized protein n=1 Tax=Burkholderia territorii TaxID=1503055 RepID=A0A6L3NM42_9BURK|nr:hypothetical protein [Burkholderia territorii]KAB0685367.1 hypothetical protein F7R13_04795 [Burkholderia territorii]MBM2771843.1 hypothetical protein [Burkholderia territorii]
MSVEVRTSEELKAAMESGSTEIIVLEGSLATQLKAVKYIKSIGPIAVSGVVAAVPLIIGAGGFGGVATAAVAPGAAWATSAIVALCIAIGGTIAISLFPDWDYVELPFGIKFKRKLRD